VDKIIVYLLFIIILFYILGIFFYFLSRVLLKQNRVASLIFPNFSSLMKKLLSVSIILFFISMLIIWASTYMLPIKVSYITIPLNYLSAILIAISLSSIEIIFFLLGFVTFGNKALFREKEPASDKTVNKLIIILLSIAMLLSVFIDYFVSMGFLAK